MIRVLLLTAALVGCASSEPVHEAVPAKVGVVSATSSSIPVEAELRGRVQASRTSEVRARVTGIVLERVFEEGDTVTQGDVLFRIDPAPMRATLAQAKAQVSVAEANLGLARLTADRLEPLAGSRAVSAQSFDEARAGVDQAEAALEVARAAVTTARLDLEYATVRAPISGRIGKALVTEGALVTAGANTQMATIVQLDPVYVDLTVPVNELRSFRRRRRSGALQASGEPTRVTLFDTDGWTYEHTGSLAFTDVTVDETTGSTLLRATVPNPDQELLPGMYVRARVGGGTVEEGVAAPKQAVTRGSDGDSVLVVEDGKVVRRPVTVSGDRGASWVVTAGLSDGDALIVDGVQHVRVGAPVTAVAWAEDTDTAEPGAH